MDTILRIKRFDPDMDRPVSRYEEFNIDLDESATVLDGLIKIREQVDGSLALRCSCRSAICGSCAMRVNGQAMLACNTNIVDAVESGSGVVTIEPAGNMPIVKDLVVDFKPFWDKIRAVDPWLKPDGPAPDGEYIAANESMLHLAGVMDCIMCGACVSDCTVLQIDSGFLGPAALAKAYRFIADPRDESNLSRLGTLDKSGGVWDCTRCMQCVEVCPKGVDPMGRIMSMRDMAIESGYNKTYGARHAIVFSDSVKHSGWLDELKLPLKTFGLLNIPKILQLLPVAIEAQLRRKVPPVFHKSLPGVENIRRIFANFEKRG